MNEPRSLSDWIPIVGLALLAIGVPFWVVGLEHPLWYLDRWLRDAEAGQAAGLLLTMVWQRAWPWGVIYISWQTGRFQAEEAASSTAKERRLGTAYYATCAAFCAFMMSGACSDPGISSFLFGATWSPKYEGLQLLLFFILITVVPVAIAASRETRDKNNRTPYEVRLEAETARQVKRETGIEMREFRYRAIEKLEEEEPSRSS